jgi:acid stress-induced BolA-like protein IbaG/YrbA
MMPIEDLRALLENGFPQSEIVLENPQGDGEHYQALIVSSLFEGKSMVEQHQMVYRALGGAMHQAVHAFALKTYTPAQWAKASGHSR